MIVPGFLGRIDDERLGSQLAGQNVDHASLGFNLEIHEVLVEPLYGIVGGTSVGILPRSAFVFVGVSGMRLGDVIQPIPPFGQMAVCTSR